MAQFGYNLVPYPFPLLIKTTEEPYVKKLPNH